MKHLYLIILFGLLGCINEPEKVKTKNFDRYVFAFTYRNNSLNNIDKNEILGTICHQLIYLTKDNYCEILLQHNDSVLFYKGHLKTNYTDSLINLIESINNKYKKTFNPEPNCISDINIIVENDTSSTYKLVNYYDKSVYDLLKDIEIKNNLQKSDTLENVLKYKYYITTKVSSFVKTHYGLSSFNWKLLELRATNDVEMKLDK